MKSDLPKVLFPVLNRPMIHWVLDALERVGVQRTIVVVGYRSDLVRDELAGRANISFVEQSQQKGTGHAVQCCLPEIADFDGPAFILAGDSPLVQSQSLQQLLNTFSNDQPSCLLGTLKKENPFGLGRIVRDDTSEFLAIVEEKDATEDQRRICEVNMSTYLFDCQRLREALGQLTNDNAQGEYYLTDCPRLLKSDGHRVQAICALQPCEALSINTVDEAALVEEQMRTMGYSCQN